MSELTPVTRKEQFYDRILQVAESGGGGGGGSTLIEKSISANGVYNASEDSADGYSKVTVDVPNTYTAQDEGKVVDNGALVAQTAMSSEVTENGTVDTTLYNSVTVNVSSGGGNNANFVSNGDEFGYNCLESIVIPQGIKIISNQSFPNTTTFNYLKTIEIPASVTSINEYAFSTGRMPNLEKIIINKPQNSISGSPWHAVQATIIWTG